jgi:hypothetical protein
MLNLGECPPYFTLQLPEVSLEHCPFRIDDHIYRYAQHRQTMPNGVTHAALDAVAFDSTPQGPAHGKPDAWTAEWLFGPTLSIKDRQVSRKNAPAFAIDPVKSGMFQ